MAQNIYNLANPPPSVGQFLDMFSTNCAPQWWALFGTIGWETVKAFITLIQPGWKDEFKWYSSNSVHLTWSGFEGEGGASWLHGGRILFQDAEEVLPEYAVKGFYWLVDLGAWIDAGVFWIMIANIVKDGVINGASMLWNANPCIPHPTFRAFHSHTDIGVLVGTNDWQPIGAWEGVDQDGNFAQLGQQIVMPNGASFEMACVFTYINQFSGEPVPLNIRVRDVGDNSILFQQDWSPETQDVKRSAVGRVKPRIAIEGHNWYAIEAQIVGVPPEFPWSTNGGRMALQWYVPATQSLLSFGSGIIRPAQLSSENIPQRKFALSGRPIIMPPSNHRLS